MDSTRIILDRGARTTDSDLAAGRALHGGPHGTDEASRAELAAIDGSGPFGPAERPMGGYAALPQSRTPELAAQWIETALAQIGTLPPTAPKSAKR